MRPEKCADTQCLARLCSVSAPILVGPDTDRTRTGHGADTDRSRTCHSAVIPPPPGYVVRDLMAGVQGRVDDVYPAARAVGVLPRSVYGSACRFSRIRSARQTATSWDSSRGRHARM